VGGVGVEVGVGEGAAVDEAIGLGESVTDAVGVGGAGSVEVPRTMSGR
jgi:hypothetical protein